MRSLVAVGIAAAVVLGSVPAMAEDAPETPEEFLQFMSYFTGEWKGTTTSEEGKHTETWTITELPSKQCHLVIAMVDGQPSGQSLWGLNPKTKRWTGAFFSSKGTYGTFTINDQPKRASIKAGDEWTSTTRAVNADGKKVAASVKWIIVDKDSVRLEITGRVNGGEKLPDEVSEMKRQ